MSEDLTPWNRLPAAPGKVGGWIGAAAGEWGTVGGVTTRSFEAYAVLPNGTEGYSLSFVAAERLRRVLREWTPADAPCFQALWQGYGELGGGEIVEMITVNGVRREGRRRPKPRLLPRRVEKAAAFEIPNRAYYAFHAMLPDLAPRDWGWENGADDEQSPTIFWPKSRTWLVASEIDLAVTFVGGPAALIEQVVADPALFARPIDVDGPVDPTWDLDYPFYQD